MDQGKVEGADNRSPPDADIARADKTIAQFMAGQGMAGGVTLEKPDGETPAPLLGAGGEGRKYAVGRILAHGGMGAILSARDLDIRRIVAMKVILGAKGAPQDRLLRFIEEAQITGQLEHPSIVPVYELGVDAQDSPFYTMKLVRGRTLKQVFEDLRARKPAALARYPLNTLLNVFLKVCDAVAFAHSRGVIHRDLKPENIMLGDYGEVLVMDWGLAKIVKTGEVRSQKPEARSQEATDGTVVDSVRFHEGGAALTTLEGQTMGTPGFMSPEQARGKAEAVGPPSDVYALGAILYNLLTLEPPVSGKTVAEVLLKVVRGQVTPPASLNRAKSAAAVHKAVGAGGGEAPVHSLRDLQRRAAQVALAQYAPPKRQGPFPHCPGGHIPEALSAVTMKAMALQPDERYASVAELHAEIEKFQAGFATQAEAAGTLRQLWLLLGRHKVESLVVAASLAVLLGAGVLFTVRLAHGRNAALASEARALDKERQAVAARVELQRVSREAAPEFVVKALRLLDTPEWAQALPVANNATVLDPDLAQAWILKGRLHLALGELKEAEAAFGHVAADAQARRYRDAIQWARSTTRPGATAPEVRLLERLVEGLATIAGDPWAAVKVTELARFRAHATGVDEKGLDLKLAAATEALVRRNPGLSPAVKWFENKDGVIGFNGDQGGAALRDLDPLRGLPLSAVSVGSTAVTDLAPLRGMPLRMLNITFTAVRDLEPLRGMPLEQLGLGSCPVRDITPLAGLPIEELDVSATQVSDFSPLASLPLRVLSVCGPWRTNSLPKNLSMLQGKKIESLNIGYTQVTDLAPLRGMPLKSLGLAGSRIADLTPLRDLPLETLDLTDTGIKDLAPLANLKLKSLSLTRTGVTDLTPLRQMPLEELTVWDTPISSLEGLRGMNTLRTLSVTGSRGIRDLTPLEGMAVTHLNFSNTSVADLRPLAGMPLINLDLSGTNVSDLSPLKGMPLGDIRFSNTQVRDLSPLKGMPLGSLFADGCPVRDLEPLRGMALGVVDLMNCREIADFSPLKDALALAPGIVLLGIPAGLPPAQMAIIRSLRNVAILVDNPADWERQQSAAEFWRKYDAQLGLEPGGGQEKNK